MSKRDSGSEPRKITIRTGREAPPKCNALLDLLRDGEKPRAGEPGTLLDRLGGEVRGYLAEQVRVADIRGTAVSGSISITIKTSTGADGSHQYATDIKTTTARIPPGVSMVFTDEDGDQIGRPMSDGPLTDEMSAREKSTGGKVSNA